MSSLRLTNHYGIFLQGEFLQGDGFKSFRQYDE